MIDLRKYKHGDRVSISKIALESLRFVPGFPQEPISVMTGTITSVWRLTHTDATELTVALDMCPEIENLQFDLKDVELVVPAEVAELQAKVDRLEKTVEKLEKALFLTNRIGQAAP